MKSKKPAERIELPLPSEGQVFATTWAEVVGRGFDHAMAMKREQCAKAAETFIQGNRDSCTSRTAMAIARLIRDTQ